VPSPRFAELARELAQRDRDLPAGLDAAARGAEALRAHAEACVEVFRAAAIAEGARHLADLVVGPVAPDEKHVDCVSFGVARGRFQVVCVAKARGAVTLVGPFKRGKTEKPCSDYGLEGAEVRGALEDLLLRLIRVASDR
jgi:hypothetical protein